MSIESEIRGALKRWILEKSNRGAEEIDDGTRIFRDGVLKSLHIMELILYIEELTERSIDVEQLRPGSFTSIDAIYESFFQPREALS